MLRHPDYTRARIAATAGRLRDQIYPDVRAVDSLRISPRVDRIGWDEARELTYRAAALGEQLGPLWSTFWFDVRATVPPAWDGRRVDLLWVTHSEATLWIDGRSVQGLNSGSRRAAGRHAARARSRAGRSSGSRSRWPATGSSGHSIGTTPRSSRSCSTAATSRCSTSRRGTPLRLRGAAAARGRARAGPRPVARGAAARPAEPLLQRLATPRIALPGRRPERARHRSTPSGTATTATRSPRSDTRTSIPPGSGRSRRRTGSASARSARRPRTWTRYPEYRFACSQAQQYAWIKQRNPDLYERIRQRVARGQFIPWEAPGSSRTATSPPASRSSGSSCSGSRSSSASSAGAAASSGTRTSSATTASCRRSCAARASSGSSPQKLSWNRFNRPAYHTFLWQGIDGSRVLTHFPPADTYNGIATWRRSAVRRATTRSTTARSTSFLLYGYGDGGGGPTGRCSRHCAASATSRASRVRRSAQRGVLRRSSRRTSADLPVLVGELYFEYHRGTYTSQARSSARTARASSCCTTSSCWRRSRTGAGARPTRARRSRASGSCCSEPVPRHHPGLVDHRGLRGRGARLRTRSGAGETLRDRRSPRSATAAASAAQHARGRARGVVESPAAECSSPPRRSQRAARSAATRRSRSTRARRRRRRLENAHLRAVVDRGGRIARARPRRAAARRWPRPGTCSRSTRTSRSTGTPGTSIRSTSRRAQDCPPAHERARRHATRRCASRSPSSTHRRALDRHADDPPRRRCAPLEFGWSRRLARGARRS